MADDKNTNTTDDDVPAADPGAPVPNAAAEPVTQAAAATGPAAGRAPSPSATGGADAPAFSSPSPASYEMPDDYATDDWVATTKDWVEEHPALALVAAAGVGILAGRIVGALFPDPEPSLADRVEKRAKSMRKDLKKEAKQRRKDIKKYRKQAKKRGEVYKKDASAFAHDAGESFEDLLGRASTSIRDAAHSAGEVAEEGVEKTKDLAETIADAAKVAVAGVVAAKIEDWVEKARK